MALQKQPININFSQGVDTKTDPFQIPIGKFAKLNNAVFNKGGLLQKANGFGALPALPDDSSLFVTTFNGDLTAIGTNVRAYASGSKSWVDKGSFTPVDLSVLPLVRNSINQVQADAVVAPNGLICTAYSETPDGTTLSYKYVIADSATGQNIIAPTALTQAATTAGHPRVFLMDRYFVIVYAGTGTTLKFIAISIAHPTTVTNPADVSTSYTSGSHVAFDGFVLNGQLYLAWNGASASGIKMTYITQSLSVSSATNPDSSNVATHVSVCADPVDQLIWVTYYNLGTTTAKVLAVDPQLSLLPNFPVTVLTSGTINNIASGAYDGTMRMLFEVSNTASGVQTNYIDNYFALEAGSSGHIGISPRSVGLASKIFTINGEFYYLGVYQSAGQSTLFAFKVFPTQSKVIARFAYQNSVGYLTTGVPNVSINGSTASIAYLIQDQLNPVNKNTGLASGTPTTGFYNQQGVNLVNLDLDTVPETAEIGGNLNVTGGFVWAYDGYQAAEQGFFLYPDSVQVTTAASAVTPTGTVTSGSNKVTALSSLDGIGIGASISGTGIPGSQFVTAILSSTSVQFGPSVATGTHAGESITVTGNIGVAQKYFYQAIYTGTDNQGNIFRSAPSIPVTITTTGTTSANTLIIPTLRLTYKTANPIKIELYRYSTAQPVYYEVTSIVNPTLNSTTADTVTIVDALNDSSILGNAILYTTGGVVENIGPPAASAVALFDDRFWLIDAENRNLLWFSKQVIQDTPVEMSDLLTTYVAPTLGAQGSTGPMTALGAMDDKLVIFKKDAAYYINGTGPDNTGANNQYSQPIYITSSVGCDNPKSVVLTPNGLQFQSDKGIWLLGRDLSTQYIGAAVDSFNDRPVTSALGIPGTNQDRFTTASGTLLMYDYYYNQWGTFDGIPAVSSTLFQGQQTYINSLGQVFQETPGKYLNGANPVLMSFKTGWLNLAGLQGYQRAYYFYLLGTYLSPHKLSIQIAYDYNPNPTQTLVISPSNFAPAYGVDTPYGQGTPYGGPLALEQWRVDFTQQRCQSFQITVQEIYDPSLGGVAGPGLTLSGINCVVGIKKGYRPLRASQQTS